MNFKRIGTLFILLILFGCSSLNKKENIDISNSKNNNVSIKKEEATKFIKVYDPLEPFNRRIYSFNYYADKYVMIPAVEAYEFIMPKIAQKGVSNFFANLQEINTFINSLLQFEGRKATITLVRFGINTTLGILGLFDVASKLKLPKQYEDFGLTLAKYGVGNGPYLVLPLLGPSNLRDATGKLAGIATTSTIDPYSKVGVNVTDLPMTTANVINTRKENEGFRYYESGSPFEYEYVRFIYTKYRETLKEVDDTK